jgi:VCBS repeat-containing protein
MSDFYKYKTIAKEGVQGIQDLGNRTSINDAGTVAFTGDLDTSVFGGNAVFVGDGFSLSNIAPASVDSRRRFGTSVEINNAGQVIAGFRQSFGGSQIRLFDSKNTNSYEIIARGDGSLSEFFATFIGSVNNSGKSVFTAIDRNFTDDLLVTASEPPSPFFNELVLPSTVRLATLKPMIADTGDVVVKFGNQANSPILLFDNDLNVIDTIASSSNFTKIGQSPGISDDGQIVVFYGEKNSVEKGIFASIKLGASRELVKIAELNNGFSSFEKDTRVAVNSTHRGENFTDSNNNGIWDSGELFDDSNNNGRFDPSQRAVTVVYMANDESGNKGIYSNRLNFFGDGTSNFDVDNPNNLFSVSRPTLVAEAGQNINGLGTVNDFNIYDPVNNRDRGDIAFWVDTAGGEAVVRARPQEVIYLDFNPVGNFSAGLDPGADALFNDLGVPLTWSGNISTVFSQFAPNRTDLDVNTIQTQITSEVQQAFDDALINVKVLSSLSGNPAPTDGRFTRVYIGDSPYGATTRRNNLNGIATALDLFNQDIFQSFGTLPVAPPFSLTKNDTALVFVDNIFRPFGNFTDSSGNPVGLNETGSGTIKPKEVVSAISNIVIHELGHTLGLFHLDDSLSNLLMNQLTNPNELRQLQRFGTNPNPLAEISGIKQNDTERLAFTVGSDFDLTRNPPVSAMVNALLRNKFSLGASLNVGSINVAQAAIGIVPLGEFDALPEFIDLGSGDLATLLDIDIDVTSEDKIILVASTDGNGIDIVSVPAGSGIDVSSIDLSNGLFVATNESLRSDIYDESGQPLASSLDLFQITPSGAVQIGTVGSEDAPPPINTPPQPVNDSTTTNEDTTVEIDVLSNDTDADNNPLTLSINETPTNGTATLNDNGTPTDPTDDTITYTPNSNFNGTDSFTYTVSDGTDTTSATVDITVNPVNDLPIAINDTAETNEDQPLTIIPSDLLSNDSDIDGDRLTITQVNNSANGTVELSEDGNILFTPDSDFNGLASFEYTVTDGTDTTSATVEITVNQNRDRNIIEGTTQRDSLIGTDSNDIITGFQGADRITTGNGEDKLVYNSIVDAGDLITDFDPSNDIIDLQGVLQSIGFDGSNAIDDGYVQLVSYGSRGTSLQIDADGADGSAIFRPYLFLQGVSVAEINDNSNLTFG